MSQELCRNQKYKKPVKEIELIDLKNSIFWDISILISKAMQSKYCCSVSYKA